MSRDDAAAVGPQEVLDFWFGAPGTPIRHAAQGLVHQGCGVRSPHRRAIRRAIERALRGELDAWAATPAGALARILLLDQFTRNAFRGDPRAFAGDAQALAAAARSSARARTSLPPLMRAFAYLPFEHAESMAMQDEAVRLFTRLAATRPELARCSTMRIGIAP